MEILKKVRYHYNLCNVACQKAKELEKNAKTFLHGGVSTNASCGIAWSYFKSDGPSNNKTISTYRITQWQTCCSTSCHVTCKGVNALEHTVCIPLAKPFWKLMGWITASCQQELHNLHILQIGATGCQSRVCNCQISILDRSCSYWAW